MGRSAGAFSDAWFMYLLIQQVKVSCGHTYLSVRHAARLKPAVKHIIHTAQDALALAAGDGDVINEVTVKVSHLETKGAEEWLWVEQDW